MTHDQDFRKTEALKTPATAIAYWTEQADIASQLASQHGRDFAKVLDGIYADALNAGEAIIVDWLANPGKARFTLANQPERYGVLLRPLTPTEAQQFARNLIQDDLINPATLIAHHQAYTEATLELEELEASHPALYEAAKEKRKQSSRASWTNLLELGKAKDKSNRKLDRER